MRDNYNDQKDRIRETARNLTQEGIESQVIRRFDDYINANFTLVSDCSPCTLHTIEEEQKPENQRQRFALATRPFLKSIKPFAKKSRKLQSIYNSVRKINFRYNGRYTFKNQTEAKVCAAMAKISDIVDFPYFLGVP